MPGNFGTFSLADQYGAATRDTLGGAKLSQLAGEVQRGQRLRQSLANLYSENPSATPADAANVAIEQGAIDEAYKLMIGGAQGRSKKTLKTLDKPVGGGMTQRYLVKGGELTPWGDPFEKKAPLGPDVGSATKPEKENASILLDKIIPEEHMVRGLDADQQEAFMSYVVDEARKIRKVKRGTTFANALKQAFKKFEADISPGEKAAWPILGEKFTPDFLDKPPQFDPMGQNIPPPPPGTTVSR